MKPSKSVNSLTISGQNPQMVTHGIRRPQPPEPQRPQTNGSQSGNTAPTSPICRCRVMYLGSSVPHITKDGLQGIQEPLRELYPDKASLASGDAGIDSWLSVWSNGILIENVDETGKEVKRFFKIEALHYCAAVKYVPLTNDQQASQSTLSTNGNNNNMPKFLPLDSPHARMQQTNSDPPIFASILRRTTGVKVLECHAFICKREAAANALVRCCFHAYADTMYAKQIGADIENISSQASDNYRPLGQAQTLKRDRGSNGFMNAARRSKSIAALNDETTGDHSDSSTNNPYQNNYPNSIMRRKSMNEDNNTNNGDISDSSQHQFEVSSNLRKQYKLSKSMHQLNQADQQQIYGASDYASQLGSHSNSIHNLASSKARWSQTTDPQHENNQPTFYNPHASRVPSYPPQNLIDQQEHQKQLSNGGTLRSIKSVAANSIASTLLRSKKHAKAMSAAQMNQQLQELNRPQITGFHQPHMAGSATLAPNQSFMMPPVPPMFLPRLPIVNGSQTMKLPRHHQQPMQLAPHPQMNFEAMTPKEMKKLLKKSAKYGLDPSKFGVESGLPPVLPFRPMAAMQPSMPCPPPPASSRGNKSDTMNSQSIYSLNGQDVTDLAAGLPPPPPQLGGPTFHFQPGGHDPMDPNLAPQAPIKSILVKPNPEFLKSKTGKKWLKQQKEFKKLLPPHLDGLPIVFGPPPIDALEPSSASGESIPNGHFPSPPGPFPPPALLQPLPQPMSGQHNLASHPGLPIMDANGYYSQPQLPMYLMPSGRASTASTLLRYSPHAQFQQQQHAVTNRVNTIDPHDAFSQLHQSRGIFNRSLAMQHPGAPPMMLPSHQRDNYVGKVNGENQRQVHESQMSGAMDNNSRQYIFSSSSDQRRRKHMIEQSVISLGDENEGEDGEDEDGERTRDSNGNGQQNLDDDEDGGQTNNYYNRVSGSSTSQQQHFCDNDQQNYEQVLPPASSQSVSNDDQGSYSSGIYRRGHINERAFSYSIRQEHKSSGAEVGEYEPTYVGYSNQVDYGNPQQQTNMYCNPQHQLQQTVYRNGGPQHNNNGRHVDELSARLEDQLNMSSFANSSSARVRSHM